MDYKGGGIRKETRGIIQIYLLLSFWFIGIVLGSTIAHMLLGEDSYATANNIRISNAIGTIFMFLIPATIHMFFFADTKGDFLVQKNTNTITVVLGILIILCIQPFVEVVNYYNNLITLPESWSGMQDFFEKSKEMSEQTIQLLISDKSIANLIINLIVIAILPGIVEELYFRGCLQEAILKSTKNKHIAIWITAILFSVMHFQLEGLFPRILLGALLGYLYIWTKNIWVPIIVHIVNNAMVIIMLQQLADTEFYKKLQTLEYNQDSSLLTPIISFAITAGLLTALYKYNARSKSKRNISENQ